MRHLTTYGRILGVGREILTFLEREQDEETLVNTVCTGLNFSPGEKQFLLEARDLAQRGGRLNDLLQFKILDAAAGRRPAS